MPFKSQAQARWAYANKDKKTKEGAAAREYVAASQAEGQKVGKMPLRVGMPKGKK